MNKLEQAVKEMDKMRAANPNYKQFTIEDREKHQAKLLFDRAQMELAQENARHQFALIALNRKINNVITLRKILDGMPGFIRCSQGQLGAQSGFTTIGEVMDHVNAQFVDLYDVEPSCPFGMEVWSIDNRGMMTLLNALRDSSD